MHCVNYATYDVKCLLSLKKMEDRSVYSQEELPIKIMSYVLMSCTMMMDLSPSCRRIEVMRDRKRYDRGLATIYLFIYLYLHNGIWYIQVYRCLCNFFADQFSSFYCTFGLSLYERLQCLADDGVTGARGDVRVARIIAARTTAHTTTTVRGIAQAFTTTASTIVAIMVLATTRPY